MCIRDRAYTTTVDNGDVSEVVSFYSTNVDGNPATGTITSVIPPPFSIPSPYTTLLVDGSSTISEIISYYSTNVAGIPATVTTTSVIPPPFSLPSPYTCLLYTSRCV